MVSKPAFHKRDADKDREELLEELEALRGYYSRLREVVKRYERAAGHKDLYRSLLDLEEKKDGVEALRHELREKQKEIDLQSEELEVQNEELRAQLEAFVRDHSDREKLIDGLKGHIAVLEKSSDLIKRAPVGVYEIDFRIKRITDVNDYMCEAMGYTREELLAMDPFDILDEESGARFRERIKKQLAGEKIDEHVEYRGKMKGGREIYFVLRATFTYDEKGRPVGAVVVGEDITERKKAEESLMLTSYSLDHVRDIVIWFCPDGRMYYVNDAACRHFGYSRDEMLYLSIFDINPSYTREDWDDRWRKLKEEGFSSYEVENRAKDGSLSPIEVTNTYIRYEGREFMVGHARDITGRKRAEEALREAKAQAELYLDLMGHDINNLHQVAMGYLELAKDLPPGEERDKLLDKPMEVLHRSTKLIGNVRKLEKLRNGALNAREVDVCRVLMDLQREYGGMPGKNITLNLNGHGHCIVRANELLQEVFSNLVSNAIKHTGDRADVIVDLDTVKDNGAGYCRVMVEDDGPGIPDDFKAKIFNRTLAGNGKSKGMGLGLYLVKSLVSSYGGRVWVEDRVIGDHSKGARFVVLLPAVEK